MIARLLAVTVPTFCVGAVFVWLGSRGASTATVRTRWVKFVVFVFIVHAVLAAAVAGTLWIGALMMAIVVVATGELVRAWRMMPLPRPLRIWIVYPVIALLAVIDAIALPPPSVAFIFVVAASFDGFSQVFGQWFGRTPLAPRISPNKTVEGLVGGLVGAALIATLLDFLLDATARDAAGWSVAVAGASLAGDLAKSWIKRRAGIKDFADVLPGHGGFLDRFDSFIAATGTVGLAMLATATPV